MAKKKYYFDVLTLGEYYIDLHKISEIVMVDFDTFFEKMTTDDLLSDTKNIKEEKNNHDESDDEYENLPMEYKQMIDIVKWEVIKGMLQVVISENKDYDDNKMGIEAIKKDITVPFKIAFNTLQKYEILNKNE